MRLSVDSDDGPAYVEFERLRSENFALFAAAMEASRESGGRLNETVDRIAHSVRELQRLERKGLVSRDRSGFVHVFSAAVSQADVAGQEQHKCCKCSPSRRQSRKKGVCR